VTILFKVGSVCVPFYDRFPVVRNEASRSALENRQKNESNCFKIPQSTLSAFLVTLQCLRCQVPPALNAPECGLRFCCCPCRNLLPPSRQLLGSARPENFIQGSEQLPFLRGLEEKKLISPYFRISSLKRLSCKPKTLKHTTRKTLSTEPRTLHANKQPVVKSIF
jgi:hypothetical protein